MDDEILLYLRPFLISVEHMCRFHNINHYGKVTAIMQKTLNMSKQHKKSMVMLDTTCNSNFRDGLFGVIP